MSTTIQTSKKTAQLLRELMKKTGARNYDEIIAAMAREKLKVPKSMFGSNPKLKAFTEGEESHFHEL
jgi:pyridoxal/pyridoxine/pyridoxamine kinase